MSKFIPVRITERIVSRAPDDDVLIAGEKVVVDNGDGTYNEYVGVSEGNAVVAKPLNGETNIINSIISTDPDVISTTDKTVTIDLEGYSKKGHTHDLYATQETVSTISDDINDIKTTLGNNITTISDHTNRIESLESSSTDISGRVDELEEYKIRVEDLEGILGDTGDSTESTEDSVLYRLNAIETAIGGSGDGGQGTSIRAKIDDHEDRLKTIKEDLGEKDKNGTIFNRLAKIETDIGDVNSNNSIIDRLTDLEDVNKNSIISENTERKNIDIVQHFDNNSPRAGYLYNYLDELTNYIEDGIHSAITIGNACKSISEGSVTIGVTSQSGIRGYYWTKFENTTYASKPAHKIYLSENQTSNGDDYPRDMDWAVGDMVTVFNENKFVTYSKIVAIEIGAIIVDGYAPFEAREVIENPHAEEYAIFAICVDGNGQIIPRNGSHIFGWNAFTTGINNLSAGSLSTTHGYNNVSAGDFSLTAGRNNISGYAAITAGWNNIGLGEKSLTVGRNNIVEQNADNCIVGGLENKVYSGNNIICGSKNTISKDSIGNIVTGYENTVSDYCNAVFGDKNTITTDKGRNLLTGHINTITFGNYNIVSGQNNTINGTSDKPSDYNAVFGGYHSSSKLGHTINGKYNIVSGAAHSVTGNANAVSGAKHTINNNYTLVSGEGNTTSANYQTIVGKYNNVDSASLFIVGNGNSSKKSNAFVVNTDGRATISKAPENDMDVVNKKYLEDYFESKLETFLINESF